MTLLEFKNSGKSLIVLIYSKVIFSSDRDALEPLIEFVQVHKPNDEIIIFDKYIGRAAAMLMSLIKPKKVYTPIISQFGRKVFESHSVCYEAEKEVAYLMGVASDEMCKWEKLSVSKTAEVLLAMLTEK